MNIFITFLSDDIVGGLSGPLKDNPKTDYSDFWVIILITVIAAIILIALTVTLIIGNYKKTWNKHRGILIGVILGIVISAMVFLFFLSACITL